MGTFEQLQEPSAIVLANADYLRTHRLVDGSGFPPSYIDFAIQLGWGRLCGLLLVYVPLGQHSDSWLVQIPKIRKFMDDCYEGMEHDPFLLEPDGYEGIEQSLVPFAMSENGECLAWNAAHRTSEGELPIYVVASRMGGIRYGAENLYRFVEKCIDKAAIEFMFGLGYQALPAIFEPCTLVG